MKRSLHSGAKNALTAVVENTVPVEEHKQNTLSSPPREEDDIGDNKDDLSEIWGTKSDEDDLDIIACFLMSQENLTYKDNPTYNLSGRQEGAEKGLVPETGTSVATPSEEGDEKFNVGPTTTGQTEGPQYSLFKRGMALGGGDRLVHRLIVRVSDTSYDGGTESDSDMFLSNC